MKALVKLHPYHGPERIVEDPDGFLDQLSGPAVFVRKGRDATRRRAVAGMLHGNEPSGYRAIHRALRAPRPPAVDTLFFIGAVEAARAEPRYSHRMLEGHQDLNRCFDGTRSDLDHEIATQALELLTREPLEAALDLHNNSGHNPPYGVGMLANPARLALSGYFSRLYMLVDWNMSTLMEALERFCPAVTIECGRSGDAAADRVAWHGLEQFLQADVLPSRPAPGEAPRILANPVRVTLRPGLSLAFADSPLSADFVMDADVDRHNFQMLPAGTRLGWVRSSTTPPVEARDASGVDRADELFAQRAGQLVTLCPLTPIMMTTVPEIAQSDCLFYAVKG